MVLNGFDAASFFLNIQNNIIVIVRSIYPNEIPNSTPDEAYPTSLSYTPMIWMKWILLIKTFTNGSFNKNNKFEIIIPNQITQVDIVLVNKK